MALTVGEFGILNSAGRPGLGRLPSRHPEDAKVGDRPGWRVAVRGGLRAWLLTRLGFYLVGYLVTLTVPAAAARSRGVRWFVWPFHLYSGFDSGHFLAIAATGYFPATGPVPAESTSPAFFPGYPLLIRGLADLLGLGRATPAQYLAAAALLALAGSAASAILLWRLVAESAGHPTARIAVYALLLGPYSVFLTASYSESVFLAFALSAWLAGKHRRWWLAGTLAATATLIRVNGIFLDAGLAVAFLSQLRDPRPPGRRQLLALTVPPLAVLGYFAWLHARTGDWMAWFDAQRRGWNRSTVLPSTALTNSVSRVVHSSGALRFQSVMEIAFAAILLAAVGALIQARRWPEAVYVGLTAASLLTSHHYLSVPRSTLICFPVTVLIAEWLRDRNRFQAVRFALSATLTLLLLNTMTFLSAVWTG